MKKFTLLTLLSSFIFYNVTAQVIFQDDFSTLTVNQPLHNQDGWSHDTSSGGTGSSIGGGPFSPIVATPLSYSNYGSSPNSLFADNTQETDGVGHLFPTTISSGTFYVSFVINVSSAPSSSGTVRDVMRVMSGQSFFTTLRLWAQESGGTGFNFGIKTGDPSNNGATTTAEYDYNVDHLVVLKYTINPNSNDDELELFVNPDFAAGEPANSTLSAPLPMFEASDSVDRIAFPWNITPSARFGGHIGLVSVALSWSDLTLSVSDLTRNNLEVAYYSKLKSLVFNSLVSGKLSVYSLEGKNVLNTSFENSNQIDLSQLKTGLYISEVELKNGEIKRIKLMVD